MLKKGKYECYSCSQAISRFLITHANYKINLFES